MPGALRDLIRLALDLYFYAIFAWVILSWVPVSPGHPVSRLQYALGRIIDPLLAPIRRVVPPLRIGMGAIDLSPLILLLAVRIVRSFF